jgi:hypothetical protein
VAAQLSVHIAPLKLPLIGMGGIDVLVDGQFAAITDFGQTATVDLAPGVHNVAVRLRGVIYRTSNSVTVHAADGQCTAATAKYNRFFGTFKLSLGG